MLINADVHTIYYGEGYADDMSMDMLKEAGMRLVRLGKS
jgi:hypothetical protein